MSLRPPSTQSDAFIVAVATAGFAAALSLQGSWGVWGGLAVASVISLALCVAFHARLLRALLFPRPLWWLEGLLGALLLSLLTYAIYPWLEVAWPGLGNEIGRLYTWLDAPPGRVQAIPILVLAVLAEECVWRGVLHSRLRQRLSRAAAVLVGSMLYAVPQLASGSWLLAAVAFGLGTLWAVQRVRSGSLWVPFLTHLGWDLVVFVALPLG